MIDVTGVSLTYQQDSGKVEALKGIDLHISPGESCAIIGPSGCGKSSLLFLMAGLLSPTKGSVSVSGVPVSGPRPETALILQDYGLFPWKNVWQNTVLGLEIRHVEKKKQKEIALPILEQLGLADFIHHFPGQLSGGMRQRVAIARALALHPDLMLMDEPFSALDALTRENLQRTVLDIWQQRRFTMVLVTHSIEEAVFLGRQVGVFSPRPGRILALMENPMAGDPSYRSMPQFYHQCTLIRGILEGSRNGG